METTITLSQLWKVMLTLCAGTVTISGAVAVVAKVVQKLKQPEAKQNERIANLEKQIVAINERLEKGDIHFNEDGERMDSLEQTMKATNRIIIESLQALTAHAIDGQNMEGLRNAEKQLNGYLIGKI